MTPRIPAIRVLEARAQARAVLFRCCEYEDSGQAVGALLAYAHETGLEDEFGLEFVLEVIRKSFRDIAGIEV